MALSKKYKEYSVDKNGLQLNPTQETERIITMLRHSLRQRLHRRGAVIGVSGGVDSAVVLALCVRAFGPKRTTAIIMPEKDSDSSSQVLGQQVAQFYGVEPIVENITPVLEGFNCYNRRDDAIKRVFPEYDADKGYRAKITLPQNMLETGTLNIFYLTIITPDQSEKSRRLLLPEYLQIVAASNFKQRTRMAMLYYYAELRHCIVVGTANKNEHDQGFFVKYGDGGVDIQPIVHLFKTQIYQLAKYLDVPQAIRERPPTTDTYSAPTTQQEFFFRLPFEQMDLLWLAQEEGRPIPEVARELGLSEQQVQQAFDDFCRKQRTTQYLRLPPLTIDKT